MGLRKQSSRLRALAVALWVWSAVALVGETRADAPLRALVLPSLDGEALERLRGQTADLRWQLLQTSGSAPEVHELCESRDAQAALWLERSEGGRLTLWTYDAVSGARYSRAFELQPPGDVRARSAQLEALALAARANLKAIAMQVRERAAKAAAAETAAQPAPTPPPKPKQRPQPKPQPKPTPADAAEPPEQPASTPAEQERVDDVVRDREPVAQDEGDEPAAISSHAHPRRAPGGVMLEAAAGYGLVHVSPLPWQQGLWLSAGVGARRWPVRFMLGFEQALTVTRDAGDARLRLGRRSAFGQLAAPFDLGGAVRLGPAVELGWLQLQRRTAEVEPGLATTAPVTHDLWIVRGLLLLDVGLWKRGAVVLWLTADAGFELAPTQVTLRVDDTTAPTELALAHAAPVLRLGLRIGFAPRRGAGR